MKGIKKFTIYATFVLGLFLWIKSITLQESNHEAISYVQTKVFKQFCTAENVMIESVLIVALFYAIISFIAVVLLCSALTSFLHNKPIIESIRVQLYRYFAFFGLLPLVITSLSWNFIFAHLPTKTHNLFTQIIEIEPILTLTAKCDGLVLCIMLVSATILTFLFAYGVGVISNIWLNRVCAIFWVFYGYRVLYITTAYIEYGVWFLLFILLCYALIAAAIIICRNKKEKPLIPQYELFILSLDDLEKTEEDQSQDTDFSIFMPKQKEDENE